ncbi:hypothetical protein PV10_01903 [Exophiala mesophila]|uniref:DNA mismatch repair protein PMS1 n=1 Tax=Exophiala mesophila TaxID=212818 RepID=A0A0D1X8B2_EXOME|nr:uncharacterized protein PV10_01903 [Exophiala mesophila]KIV98235.1 hypothetical protein PV10_01903 [Exophiala mesophila]
MATIKAIEARSVHQIQSGQVIVDLCSVAKELVENGLDAGATSIEVRFKNYGLDSIEVQDNGTGISPSNYETVALKHYTSKLANYDDLSTLRTFGFRGEALSSLCALSNFSMTTAQADEVPKGKRLEFDTMGKLKSTTTVASQRGTTATVEDLFEGLPVRRKELSKNVKREYGKVLSLLHAYACIGVGVKFTVKHTIQKGKSTIVFSTKGNASTRENIANVYGAKTLAALVPLDLTLDSQSKMMYTTRQEKQTNIQIKGHISKPVFGEGRLTPDRQMFFVNGRPCGLPQMAKAINEVYKSYNVSQTPFIFADFIMDTDSYDVNVSPDKRIILLHDSASLIENLKSSLTEMFDQQEQTVPQSKFRARKLAISRASPVQRQISIDSANDIRGRSLTPESTAVEAKDDDGIASESPPAHLFVEHFGNFASTRERPDLDKVDEKGDRQQEGRTKRTDGPVRKVFERAVGHKEDEDEEDEEDDDGDALQRHSEESDTASEDETENDLTTTRVQQFNTRMTESGVDDSTSRRRSGQALEDNSHETKSSADSEDVLTDTVPDAFSRMRTRRAPAEVATITIGDKTVTTILGTQFSHSQQASARSGQSDRQTADGKAPSLFSQSLRRFGVHGPTEAEDEGEEEEDGLVRGDSDSDGLASERGPSTSQEASDRSSSVNKDGFPVAPEEDSAASSDGAYIDDEEKKREEEMRVAELIRAAEEASVIPTKDNMKRAAKAMSATRTRDSTTNLLATVNVTARSIAAQVSAMHRLSAQTHDAQGVTSGESANTDAETRLSLTVSKADFAKMQIVGQFNLGFIIAVRRSDGEESSRTRQDELFIIDQHASDEKYNFERLQGETVVGNQRLVQPIRLDLTAVEEEIVLENQDALERNGFEVEMDLSGEEMVGRRCRLISLPLSKEVVFNTKDLEELIQMLAEAPVNTKESTVPRPSKVRKMFAMRACRSSIMIGKTLSLRQMERVVQHMGTIDKPWNCPHGRPTMRHLCSLNDFRPWHEGDDLSGEMESSVSQAFRNYTQTN